jgi:hypothetical protein
VKSILRRRPSPALIISCIALFVSLGGVSYGVATGFIDSREIKNNEVRSVDLRNNQIRTFDIRNNEVRGFDIRNSSVQGRDVALNTLTGADISETSLDKVPSATQADTAGTASNAQSVGGLAMQRVSWTAQAGAAPQQLLSFGGLTLQAECTPAGAVEVTANPTVANAEISANFGGVGGTSNNTDFDPGQNWTATAAPGNELGTIVFSRPDGSQVTVELLSREDTNDVGGTTADCGLFGIAAAG